jgi:processive 1,2-diacylglycerol beta-glucosyltransferase
MSILFKDYRGKQQHTIQGAEMIQLSDKENGTPLGTISEADLQFLIDNLEEEWAEDTDYYLNRTTFEMLKNKGAGQSLLDILEPVFNEREDIEIEWSRS